MSGSVFVLDSQNTPLMPMGAAHARALLARGAAQWIQHPSFKIIRLTRIIASPVRHPIVVGLRISSSMAELFVVSTSLRVVRPLLYIVVERHHTTRSLVVERVSHRRIRGRVHESLQLSINHRVKSSLTHSTRRRYATVIRRTITALQQFIPLTHIVLLPPYAASGSPHRAKPLSCRCAQLPDPALDYFLPSLLNTGLFLSALPPLALANTCPMPDIPMLNGTLAAFQARPMVYTPCLVAVPSIQPLVSAGVVTGVIATATVDGQQVTGIVTGPNGRLSRRYTLRVPISVSTTDIIWHRLRLDALVRLQHQTTGAMEFLPLSIQFSNTGIGGGSR